MPGYHNHCENSLFAGQIFGHVLNFSQYMQFSLNIAIDENTLLTVQIFSLIHWTFTFAPTERIS